MPHLHEFYDFVVSIFIIYQNKVLLIYHKKYKEWLPIGGHIELNEDPEEALYREIQEECGLNVKVLARKPAISHAGVKPLLTPSYVDAHRIAGKHRHVAFIYFGSTGSDQVVLHEREHREYRWVSKTELKKLKPRLTKSIDFYCRRALLVAIKYGK